MPEPTLHGRHRPDVAGTFSGSLLIVGTSRYVLQDIERYWGPHGWNHPLHDIMAVSQIGCFLPKMRHWYTAHHEQWPVWKQMRTGDRVYCPLDSIMFHANAEYPGAVRWSIEGAWACVSGMQAAVIGCELGYSQVILAGIPSDNTGHFYPCHDFEAGNGMFHNHWDRLAHFFAGRVKSLSGKTREMFGEP